MGLFVKQHLKGKRCSVVCIPKIFFKHIGTDGGSWGFTTQGMSRDPFKLHRPLELQESLPFHKALGH